MPFETTPNLPGNPLVTVKFSGLMVLQPGDNKTCKVGVHKFNRTHLFQAILVISKPGQAPILITLFTGPLQDNFSIRLDPDPNPAQGDFKVLQKGNFDPTTLANPNPAGADNNANDYRWAINLQAPAGGIAINEGGAPFVILKTGVLFTPNLTDPAIKPKLKRPPAAEITLKHIAPELAVAIEPPNPATRVELEWKDMGNPMNKTLSFDGNTRYTVYLMNEPPNLDFDPHNEFDLYYKILRRGGVPVPEDEQCKLEFEPDKERLDQIPCNPVTLNP